MKIALLFLVTFFFSFSLPIKTADNLLNEKGLSKSKKSSKKAEVSVNFCLLDKNGAPSNTFTEGENFSFSLTLQNNSGDSLFLDNSFLLSETGFCTVYNENNEPVGQPFKFSGAQIVSSDVHPFFGTNRIFNLLIPWNDNRSSWSTLHCMFKSIKKAHLPKGKYYTVFKHRFCFDRASEQPSLCLDPTNIRVDFEIK